MAVASLVTLGASSAAFAASDEDEVLPDARLTGYGDSSGTPLKVDLGGGVALTYAISAVLGAIAMGVTFKNANRTHLD